MNSVNASILAMCYIGRQNSVNFKGRKLSTGIHGTKLRILFIYFLNFINIHTNTKPDKLFLIINWEFMRTLNIAMFSTL